jgi:hypothetical protein
MWRKRITVFCNLTGLRFFYPDIEINPIQAEKDQALETR